MGPYLVGSVPDHPDAGFLWQTAWTESGLRFGVLAHSGALSFADPPAVLPMDRLDTMVARIRQDPALRDVPIVRNLVHTPTALAAELRVTGRNLNGLPIVERTPAPGPAIAPSPPLPLGRDARRPDPPPVPVDTRPAWYVSRIPGGAYAWRPTPGDPGTVQVLRIQRNNRLHPVRWPSTGAALENFATWASGPRNIRSWPRSNPPGSWG